MTNDLETKIQQETTGTQHQEQKTYWQHCVDYIRGCINPEKARLYGTFQERTALNITQFPKIQGSLLIRMGLVYPIMSYLVEKAGIPKDAHSDLYGLAINYHTWAAGYLAYLMEIQFGLSKYPIELVSTTVNKARNYFSKK